MWRRQKYVTTPVQKDVTKAPKPTTTNNIQNSPQDKIKDSSQDKVDSSQKDLKGFFQRKPKDSSQINAMDSPENKIKDFLQTNTKDSSPNQIHDTISPKPQFEFQCQQVQGGPVGIISGFSNMKELYQKIAEYYEFPADQILFCTLNTYKLDMNRLLVGPIGLNDFIFVHRKGQWKEIEMMKMEDSPGLTITDNGAGYCFIKKIREGSIAEKHGFIHVGDHIEKINNQRTVGKGHMEVAQMLRDIPMGSTFTLTLVEPLRPDFGQGRR